jgi:hypothetical protein
LGSLFFDTVINGKRARIGVGIKAGGPRLLKKPETYKYILPLGGKDETICIDCGIFRLYRYCAGADER